MISLSSLTLEMVISFPDILEFFFIIINIVFIIIVVNIPIMEYAQKANIAIMV